MRLKWIWQRKFWRLSSPSMTNMFHNVKGCAILTWRSFTVDTDFYAGGTKRIKHIRCWQSWIVCSSWMQKNGEKKCLMDTCSMFTSIKLWACVDVTDVLSCITSSEKGYECMWANGSCFSKNRCSAHADEHSCKTFIDADGSLCSFQVTFIQPLFLL